MYTISLKKNSTYTVTQQATNGTIVASNSQLNTIQAAFKNVASRVKIDLKLLGFNPTATSYNYKENSISIKFIDLMTNRELNRFFNVKIVTDKKK